MPNLVIAGSSSACFKSVQQGEYVVGLTYEDGAVTLVKDGAENIRLQYPTNGTSASAFGCALVKNGPNPENAKLMIDFICSAEGQSAIAALQEAGNKTSRDMITGSYRSFTKECYLSIELIREFYDETRTFRITGDTGQYQYVEFDNRAIKGQPLPPAYPGQEMEPGYSQSYRKPVFDIVVKPQKRSPYSKMAQNELAKELYQLGFFNPQLAEQSMTALELMDFDGEEKVKDKVQQGQTLMNQLAAMQQQLVELATLVAAERGMPVGSNAHAKPAGGAVSPAPAPKGESMGKAQKDAQTATMTAYGQRLAENAKPNMETQQ
jgi:hypothetical protein